MDLNHLPQSSTITKRVVQFYFYISNQQQLYTYHNNMHQCTEGINTEWGILTDHPKAFTIYCSASEGLTSCSYTRDFWGTDEHCTLQFCLCSLKVKYCFSSSYLRLCYLAEFRKIIPRLHISSNLQFPFQPALRKRFCKYKLVSVFHVLFQ